MRDLRLSFHDRHDQCLLWCKDVCHWRRLTESIGHCATAPPINNERCDKEKWTTQGYTEWRRRVVAMRRAEHPALITTPKYIRTGSVLHRGHASPSTGRFRECEARSSERDRRVAPTATVTQLSGCELCHMGAVLCVIRCPQVPAVSWPLTSHSAGVVDIHTTPAVSQPHTHTHCQQLTDGGNYALGILLLLLEMSMEPC